MKRFAVLVCTVAGLALGASPLYASWGSAGYSGYQPWWNIFAKRYKCLTPEEERLQKFWHDYYDALKNFYCALDHVDWVAYYKNHGYAINGGCGPYGSCGRINYAPVFVSPTMQWAVPANCTGGPPVGPSFGPGGPVAPGAYAVPPGAHAGGPPPGMGYPGMMPPGMMPPGGGYPGAVPPGAMAGPAR